MSSQRYSESRSLHEETRRGTDGIGLPINSRVTVPIQFSTDQNTDQRIQERIRQKETTVEWVNDPSSGVEKFRVTINIDGFHQNEVNMRVDGNKLVVYGEHVENQNESTAKKIIEKSYELPRDIDIHSPRVTYPTPITMQIDFPSRHSNVIIDDGRLSTKLITDFDTSYRAPPRFTQEKSSSEFTSTRKIGGGGGITSSYERSSSPRINSSYDALFDNTNTGRNNTYASTNYYASRDSQSPSRRGYIDSRFNSSNNTTNPTYTYRIRDDDILPPRTTFPSTLHDDGSTVVEKKFTETRSETHHRRSSPTTGVQSSHEIEHHRSGSPSIAQTLDEDRFRTNLIIRERSMTPPRSSRNVEVREFSRRVGTGANTNDNNFISTPPSLFTQGFNSDAFYRSAFQPQVFTDDRGQNRIEMKLEVNNYEPNEIKVSVKGNDLIVQAEHSVERPPTSSTRAYFFKQITLPPNTDLGSISSEYHPDGKLHIKAKLSNEKAAIRNY